MAAGKLEQLGLDGWRTNCTTVLTEEGAKERTRDYRVANESLTFGSALHRRGTYTLHRHASENK